MSSVDHGEKNASYLVGDQEILTADKLDAMLDGFDPQRQVVVILEACYSGSFLDALKFEPLDYIFSLWKDTKLEENDNIVLPDPRRPPVIN